MEDEGDVQVLVGLEQLVKVMAGLLGVRDEVANVGFGFLWDDCTKMFDDLLHFRLVAAVEDDVEALSEELGGESFAYAVCCAGDDRVRSGAMAELVDRGWAEEVEPDVRCETVEMGKGEDTRESTEDGDGGDEVVHQDSQDLRRARSRTLWW